MKRSEKGLTMKETWKAPLSEIWKDFYGEKYFCDLTLACEDRQIQCHKAIVSSSSPIFKKILKQSSSENTLIILKGLKYENLEKIISFMYKGEVNICETDLGKFLTLAKELQIKGIAEESERVGFLKVNLPQKHINYSAKLENISKDLSDTFNTPDISDKSNASNKPSSRGESNIVNKTKTIHDFDTFNKTNFNDRFSASSKTKFTDEIADNDKDNKILKVEMLKENEMVEKQIIKNLDLDRNRKLESHETNSENQAQSGRSILISYISELSTLANDQEKNSAIFPKKLETFISKNKKYLDNFIAANNKSYICKICDKQYTACSGLKYHVETVHEGKTYSCDSCPKKFKDTNSLNRHKSTIHLGIIFSCDQCEAKMIRKNELNAHIASKHEGIRHPCKQCNFIGIKLRSLREHIKIVHQGIRKQCDKCDFQAKTGLVLKRHLEGVHLGIRYPCKECNYVTVDKYSLKKHIENNHKGLFFPCNQCDYEAKSNINLMKHLKTQHKD